MGKYKLLPVLVIAGIFLLSAGLLFAQVSDEKTIGEVDSGVAAKETPSYSLNLKQLMKEAEKNIEKIDGELKKQEAEEENKKKEIEAREHFDKGNQLSNQGDLKGAKEEWQKALDITKDPEMKDYIRTSESRAKKEEYQRKLKEREDRLFAEKESREKARLEKERAYQEKLAAKEAERKARLEKARIEKEEKERLRKEEFAKEEGERIAAKEKARLEREERARLVKEAREAKEKARLEKKRARQQQTRDEQK